MTQPLHIKDEHDEGTIQPGQCFSLIFWAMEYVVAFGRYVEDDTVEIYVLDEDDFVKNEMTTTTFLEQAGFNYCDMVIIEVHPLDMTLEDVKTHLKN